MSVDNTAAIALLESQIRRLTDSTLNSIRCRDNMLSEVADIQLHIQTNNETIDGLRVTLDDLKSRS